MNEKHNLWKDTYLCEVDRNSGRLILTVTWAYDLEAERFVVP